MATRYDELEIMRWFVLHMLNNLDLAAGQGQKERMGWREEEPRDLWAHLMEEMDELEDAFQYSTDLQKVIKEAADVALLAMMLADRVHRKEAALAGDISG